MKQLGGVNPPEIVPEAMRALLAYGWPGNVRQLRNCLERALLLANDNRITPNELPPEVTRTSGSSMTVSAGSISPGFAGPAPAPTVNGGEAGAPTSLADVERQQIIAALEQTGWHRGKAAEILGISPSTLYRRLRDYNLERRLQS